MNVLVSFEITTSKLACPSVQRKLVFCLFCVFFVKHANIAVEDLADMDPAYDVLWKGD